MSIFSRCHFSFFYQRFYTPARLLLKTKRCHLLKGRGKLDLDIHPFHEIEAEFFLISVGIDKPFIDYFLSHLSAYQVINFSEAMQ